MAQSPIEWVTGAKKPWASAALYEIVALVIFLTALFWPGLSLENMIKGGLIGAFWAVLGFLRFLGAFSRR